MVRGGDRRLRHGRIVRHAVREPRRGDAYTPAAGAGASRVYHRGRGSGTGSLLAKHLLDLGYEVSGVVRRDPTAYAEGVAPLEGRVRLVEANLLDHESARALRADRPPRSNSPPSVPRSWDEPNLTASSMGAAKSIRRSASTRRRRAVYGEPRETPERADGSEPTDAIWRRQGVRALILAELPAAIRDPSGCGILDQRVAAAGRLPPLRKVRGRRPHLTRSRGGARRRRPDWSFAGTTCGRCGSCSSTTSPAYVATGVSHSVEDAFDAESRSTGAISSGATRRYRGAAESTISRETHRRRAACPRLGAGGLLQQLLELMVEADLARLQASIAARRRPSWARAVADAWRSAARARKAHRSARPAAIAAGSCGSRTATTRPTRRHRAPASHRLDRRQAKPSYRLGKTSDKGRAGQTRRRPRAPRRCGRPGCLAGAGQHEPQAPLAAEHGERLEEARVVLCGRGAPGK